MFAAAFVIAVILLAGAACALCLAQGEGLAESVEQTLGSAVKTLSSMPKLGECMDEKTAKTVVFAADIILDTLTPLKRLAFSALLRGVFLLPAF